MSANPDDLENQAVYLQSTAGDLLKRYKLLSTFSGAAQWDADAQALIRLFEKYHELLDLSRSQAEQSLRDVKAERGAMPFHRRIFSSRGQEKSISVKIKDFDKSLASLEKAIVDLQQLIDSTPSSKAEQKEMLASLNVEKKELTLEKRGVNEEMRQIRTKARQDMSAWTGVSGKYVGGVARYKRATIRSSKESSLSPLEVEKTGIEAQLIDIERQINFVSKFTGENPQEEGEVIRCAYCGRRVFPPSVCSGCGSDQTTRVI